MKNSRIEYKYLVPNFLKENLYNLLFPYLILDKYSSMMPNKEYTVRSIYFDSVALDFYQEKKAGLKIRKKLRIRGYNEYDYESVVFLEIKRKNGQIISKDRVGLMFKNINALLNSGFVSNHIIKVDNIRNPQKNAEKFFFFVHNGRLKPVIKIIYERQAFFYKFNQNWRITFDKNLRSSLTVNPSQLFYENKTVRSLNDSFILEIKGSGKIPLVFRNIIGHLEINLQSLSKYTICMESQSKYKKVIFNSINNNKKFQRHKNIHNILTG